MNTVLVSMINRKFMMAWVVFIKSLLKNNPWFDNRIILLNLDLDDSYINECKKYYDKITFLDIQKDNYSDVNFTRTQDVLKCTFYKLDTFLIPAERIVFIDLDVLIQGDISELFNEDSPFSATTAYAFTRDQMRGDFNSGVFVVNKQFLNRETYDALLRIAKEGFSMPDQKTMNHFFKGKVKWLPKMYNCEKRLWKSKKYKFNFDNSDSVRIIHYVSQKPWDEVKNKHNEGFEHLEKKWWDCYNE